MIDCSNPTLRRWSDPEKPQIHSSILCQLHRPSSASNHRRVSPNCDSSCLAQDKLHQNLARRRTLVAVGTHDLDKIAPGDITYEVSSFVSIRRYFNSTRFSGITAKRHQVRTAQQTAAIHWRRDDDAVRGESSTRILVNVVLTKLSAGRQTPRQVPPHHSRLARLPDHLLEHSRGPQYASHRQSSPLHFLNEF